MAPVNPETACRFNSIRVRYQAPWFTLLVTHGTVTVICAGCVIMISPAQAHISLQLVSSAGKPAIVTVGVPGVHGAVSTGIHGAGVNTPIAAAVSAITAGLLVLMHMANGGTFTIGLLSMIVAAGIPPAVTRFSGRTIRAAGVVPKLHFSMAPVVISGVDMTRTPEQAYRPSEYATPVPQPQPAGGIHQFDHGVFGD